MALTDNLVAYWSLDEASGDALDAVGTNDLTDTNTVGAGTGKVSGARDFERDSSQHFLHSDNADLSVGDIDFTVAAWVKLESKPADEMTIVAKTGGGAGDYFLSYTDNTDRFQFQVYAADAFGSPTSIDADNLGAPSTGTWYFIVAWHDATANTINIQVNNGTVNSAAHSGGIIDAASTTFYVGGDPFSNFFDGLIDEVGFWKRTLTTQERTDLYNSGAGLAYPLVPVSGSPYALTAGASSFTETGVAATLKAARKLSATSASFSLTGQTATLAGPGAKSLTADAGSFTLTGQDIALEVAVEAGIASFTLTGQAATLTYTPRVVNNYSLTGGLGAFTLAGIAASLRSSGSPWTPVTPASGTWTPVN